MNVKRILFSLVILTFLTINTKAQDGYIQQGEFGFTVGAAHYFGDLNTRSGLNRPKPSLGLFFRKQFGNYVGLRVAGRFAKLGYDDLLSKNSYQYTRGLEFNTNIFEFGVQGDFNFFKYIPNDINYGFTPYMTLGLGVFSFSPYATAEDGTIVPLNNGQIKTEGVTYEPMAICVPLGVGIKYSINQKVNLSFEITHRFTNTDRIDDVSGTYLGLYLADGVTPNLATGFWDRDPANNNLYIINQAGQLQDRSVERGGALTPLGTAGRQRGWSKQKDQYVIAEIGISFNIGSYRCPTAN